MKEFWIVGFNWEGKDDKKTYLSDVNVGMGNGVFECFPSLEAAKEKAKVMSHKSPENPVCILKLVGILKIDIPYDYEVADADSQ